MVGRHLVGVDGRGRDVAAHQDGADAEALRGGERGGGAAQVLGEGLLVDALDVAQRLVEVQRQPEPAARVPRISSGLWSLAIRSGSKISTPSKPAAAQACSFSMRDPLSETVAMDVFMAAQSYPIPD